MTSYNLKWEQHSAENLVHSSSVAPYIFRRILYTHTDTHTHTWWGGNATFKNVQNCTSSKEGTHLHLLGSIMWQRNCSAEEGFLQCSSVRAVISNRRKRWKFAAQVRRFQHDVHACIWCCAHLRRAASSLASKVDRNSSLSAALTMLPTHEPIYAHYWYTCKWGV